MLSPVPTEHFALRTSHSPPRCHALLRCGNADACRQVIPGETTVAGHQLRRRALCGDLTAVRPGLRPQLDHVIGCAHHRVIMLHDEHRIAQIAQALERADEPLIIRRVQANAGLVQHIEHASQARADLCGQPNALGFATTERATLAVQRQIAEPNIFQEAKTLRNLSPQFIAVAALVIGERYLFDPVQRVGNTEVTARRRC